MLDGKIVMYLKKHKRLTLCGIIAMVLSLVVVFCVTASLTMPAISMADEQDNGISLLADMGEALDPEEGKQGYHFEPDIIDVTVSDVTDTGDSDVKHVTFSLGYALQAEDVSYNPYQPYIWYQLDSHINIPPGGMPQDENGNLTPGIVTDSGVQSGTYVITEDGYIIIRFLDEYLREHNGQAISGDLRFEADVERADNENDTSIDIPFGNQNVTIDGFPARTLGVSKRGINNGDGTITWTIIVENPRGEDLTGHYLEDAMFSQAENITVSPENAGAYNSDTDRFEIFSGVTSDVAITYTTSVPGDTALNGGNAYNNAEFNNNNDELIDSDDEYVWCPASINISKSGTADYESDTATWIVTIENSYGLDLGGYTITDTAFTADTVITGLDESEYTLIDGVLTFTEGFNDRNISFTYTTVLTDDDASYSNRVELTTGDASKEATATVEKPYTITKNYGTNWGESTFTWTITVSANNGGTLNGYSVTDNLLSTGLENGTLTVQTPDGTTISEYTIEGDTITFGTLPEGTDEIIIRYETHAIDDATSFDEQNNVYITENNASLTDPDGEVQDSDSETGNYYPVNNIYKTSGEVIYDEENSTMEIPWTVTIQQDAGAFKGKSFEDIMTIEGTASHYISENATISVQYADDAQGWQELDESCYDLVMGENNTSFTITFSDSELLDDVDEIRISYTSIVDYSDAEPGSVITVRNSADFNDRNSEHSFSYTIPDGNAPYIKYDGGAAVDGQTDGTTSHKPSELDRVTIDGVDYYLLQYHIVVNQNSAYQSNENIMLKDTFPQGFTLYEEENITITRYDGKTSYLIKDQNYGNYYTLSTDENDCQVMTFQLEYWVHNGGMCSVDYSIKIPVEQLEEMLESNNGVISFTNRLQDSNGEYEKTEQTQEIEEGVVSKTGSQPTASDGSSLAGYIDYVVDINPNAEDLSLGDTLTLIDTLRTGTYYDSNGNAIICNDPGAIQIALRSIEVYQVDPDGNETPLPSNQYSYIFDDTRPVDVETSVGTITNSGNNIYISNMLTGSDARIIFTGTPGVSLSGRYGYTSVGNGVDWNFQNANFSITFDSSGYAELSLDVIENCPDDYAILLEFWGGTENISSVSADFTRTTHRYAAQMTFTVPDGRHLRIRYRYYGWRETDAADDSVGVFNSISIETNTVSDSASDDSHFIIKDHTQATSTANAPIEIKKVDIGNDGIFLNATFNLYKYDETADEWLAAVAKDESVTGADFRIADWSSDPNAVPIEIVTDESGVITIMLVDSTDDDGALYKLEEIREPDGYIKLTEPFYFAYRVMPDRDSIPSDVDYDDIRLILSGSVLAVDNTKEISVTAEKTWSDSANHENDKVTLQLYSSTVNLSDGFPDDLTAVGDPIVVSYQNGMWSYTWDNLPNGNADGLPLYYYVQEIAYNIGGTDYTVGSDGAQYIPSYSGNGINSDGTILIRNEQDLTVEKAWEDRNGNDISPPEDVSITFSVYRSTVAPNSPDRENDANGVPIGSELVGENYTLNADNSWSTVINNLAAADDSGNRYYYYVVETSSIEGYSVSYSNNGTGSKGTITIINRSDTIIESVQLPETGGRGTAVFYAAGVALVIGVLCGFYVRNKRLKKNA